MKFNIQLYQENLFPGIQVEFEPVYEAGRAVFQPIGVEIVPGKHREVPEKSACALSYIKVRGQDPAAGWGDNPLK